MAAASAGTRRQLWAPHRRPSALKGRGNTQILSLSRYLGVAAGVHNPSPRTPGQACQSGRTQSMERHMLRVKCSGSWA